MRTRRLGWRHSYFIWRQRPGLGLSTFAHTYRKLSGESPYRSIIRLKLEAAKRLLLQERLSVKETAARLGYSSEFQLSRCFKRMEGRSPSAHVRAMTEKGRARTSPDLR